jgi:transcriptional regulator with XRE-family HTH domain
MNQKLKDELARHKRERGTTQRAIAAELEVDEARLSAWAGDHRQPNPEQVARLCSELGVEPLDIGYELGSKPVVRRVG